MNEKKRHHYVPIAYLNAFRDDRGRIRVYRKDEPTKILHVHPSETALRRYYYSQPSPDGGNDNNRLEDYFSSLEAKWPPIVERMRRRENVNDVLDTIFEFIALQRVRVPASRDVTEARLAAMVKDLLQTMYARGELPPAPPSLAGRLDQVMVSIDPHKSIHGMAYELQQSVAQVFNCVGLCLVHNNTNRPFLTSDNPVVWFDPLVPDEAQEPYAIFEGGPALMLFPVSPTLLLMGSSDRKETFGQQGLLHTDAPDDGWVVHINEQVCRYGYEAVFAQSSGQEDIIERYASMSPVFERVPSGVGRMVFGKRKKLPKWKPSES